MRLWQTCLLCKSWAKREKEMKKLFFCFDHRRSKRRSPFLFLLLKLALGLELCRHTKLKMLFCFFALHTFKLLLSFYRWESVYIRSLNMIHNRLPRKETSVLIMSFLLKAGILSIHLTPNEKTYHTASFIANKLWVYANT